MEKELIVRHTLKNRLKKEILSYTRMKKTSQVDLSFSIKSDFAG